MCKRGENERERQERRKRDREKDRETIQRDVILFLKVPLPRHILASGCLILSVEYFCSKESKISTNAVTKKTHKIQLNEL
jgi:hypothetical protein